ncbi:MULTISPECIES: hypothetical protein [unclassified Legionella]|uniref:hypothetical protein n=1 Tax=unclassified Legionella TaxID=2622702 RepID=UPI001056D313|nr:MULTISPECIES: hypothetical protein [unclassified Legionella]MDI9818603.1 hypothetical protein [Legionella sp. PL877]
MNQAQDFVDALRSGHYLRALELAIFINSKYTRIKSQIGADELIPLGVYELSQTDLDESDMSAINFLYNYIFYHDELTQGEEEYMLMTLLSLVSMVLVIKEDQTFERTIRSVTIENDRQLKDFLKDDSAFSKLIEQHVKEAEKWLKAMMSPLSKMELLKKIEAMEERIFSNFESDINRLKQQLSATKINFSCALLESRIQTRVLKEIVSEFKLHLLSKLEKAGIILTNEDELVLLTDPNTKQLKLMHRYGAIVSLEAQIKEKILFEPEDKDKIEIIIKYCNDNETKWKEREFNQKCTDVLTGGLKPLYRRFFKKETLYKQKIDAITRTLQP